MYYKELGIVALQYKMFLLNYDENDLQVAKNDLYNTKCSY